jgi:hypothetical protein
MGSSPTPGADGADTAVLPGTSIGCTDEVARRVRRIAVPFVRRMVIDRVARAARADGIARVDVAFFERAASF